jgi:hypothetical protein
MIISYYNDKSYFESIETNYNLTDQERSNIVSKMININNIILTRKKFRDDKFIGLFIEKGVGDLELFDLKKVPIANYGISLDNKRDER